MNETATVAQSAPAPSWHHACGGVWRLTWPRFFSARPMLTTGVLLGLIAFLCATSVDHGASRQFVEWSVWFYLSVLVPMVAFLFGARAVRDDMGSVPVDYLLTRPTPRHMYLVFRYICHVACMQIVFLVSVAALGGVGLIRGIEDLGRILLFLFLGQFLLLIVFTALGFFGSALSQRYLIFGLVYGAIVEGGIGNIPIQLNRLSLLHHLHDFLAPITGERSGAGVRPELTMAPVMFLLAFSVVYLALGVWLFSSRQFTGERSKDD